MAGFEPTASCTRNKRATKLRYIPFCCNGYNKCILHYSDRVVNNIYIWPEGEEVPDIQAGNISLLVSLLERKIICWYISDFCSKMLISVSVYIFEIVDVLML